MSVHRITNYIDGYRLRALSPDIHRLTARQSRAGTEFVSSQILAGIALSTDDILVDIGCGDGSLLKMADGRAGSLIGVVPSDEENQRLASVLPGVKFSTGLVQKLPLETASATKIVCNAVLILLGSEDEVKASLREMYRIARPGAVIWVGEISEIDEYSYHGQYRGNSMVGFLWHLLRRNGWRAFLGMCRRWMLALIGQDDIVLNSAGTFYISPDKMIALAHSCGLRLKVYFRHKDLDEEGRIVDSKFRYDYVFEK
jgi:SAM-dependent methyltransferase